MAHDAGHHRRKDGVALELLGRGIGQQDGHEGESGVAEQVQDHIRLAGGVDQMEGGQQGQQSLDHACAGQGRDNGREDGGNEGVTPK